MQINSINNTDLKSVVRLKKIEFTNFRNIGKGSISFPNAEWGDVAEGAPSILGFYGQNGSGKTSVIMSLAILKRLLTGQVINKDYTSCIRKGYDRCSLSFIFGYYLYADIDTDNEADNIQIEQAEIFYSFDLVNKPDPLLAANVKNIPSDRLFVENEIIQTRRYLPNGTIILPKQVLIDASIKNSNKKGYAFGNATKYSQYVGDSAEVRQQLLLLKKKKYINGKSFIFSKDLLSCIFTDTYSENAEAIVKWILKASIFFNCHLSEEENPLSTLTHLLEASCGESDFKQFEKLRKAINENDADIDEELALWYINYFMSLIDEADTLLCKLDSSHKKWPLIRRYSIEEIEADSCDFDIEAMLTGLRKRFDRLSCRSNCFALLSSLILYGEACLHIVDTSITGQTNLNKTLPLLLWDYEYKSDGIKVVSECINLNMDEKTGVLVKKFPVVEKSVSAINTVLSELIPDIKLTFDDFGVSTDDDGTEKHFFEIQSVRNGTKIPLKYESDGVRRIVSLTSLFIAAYNEPSFTVAIDEIDSGIFEYLLGEIFKVMAESAKGQFIFTSHNLRPLEVLPAKYLCFTTVNPENRFVKISNRGNCNLRDTYFRTIVLGTDSDLVYQPTDEFRIHRAFYMAGNKCGGEFD